VKNLAIVSRSISGSACKSLHKLAKVLANIIEVLAELLAKVNRS
jgi:hypothetical protein